MDADALDADADKDADSEADADIDADVNAKVDVEVDAHAHAHAKTHANADVHANAHADADADGYADAHARNLVCCKVPLYRSYKIVIIKHLTNKMKLNGKLNQDGGLCCDLIFLVQQPHQ